MRRSGRIFLDPFSCSRPRISLQGLFCWQCLLMPWHGCPILAGYSSSAQKSRLVTRKQNWFYPYPAGEPSRISNDSNQYTSLSVTADGTSFVTTLGRPQATIYVGDSPACSMTNRLEANSDLNRTSDRIGTLLDRSRKTPATGWSLPRLYYQRRRRRTGLRARE